MAIIEKAVRQSIFDVEHSMFDNAIVSHGFTSYMRDYEIIVNNIIDKPDVRFRFLFTHCVFAEVITAITDATWRDSWTEEFTRFDAWQEAGSPAGFVWGVEWMGAYPGMTVRTDSVVANPWTLRLGKPMQEAVIETNCQNIRLVYHDVSVAEIRDGPKQA